jgi:crotonobetainyl-CoA:carnitine CoA-transferase CaiB-like acyl-CoA transferase
MLADLGASVICIDTVHVSNLDEYLDHGKLRVDNCSLKDIRLIVAEGSPATLRARRHDYESLRNWATNIPIVLISPFGQTGPRAEDPATDLTLFASSGIARLLTGQVDDLGESPIRAAGEQSSFIGGLSAACAGMHAVLSGGNAMVDVSINEALATLAMTELARAGQSRRQWERRRETDGNGATVCILPTQDGFAAISPREERQWQAWLSAMGSPAWGDDPRFKTKSDRIANWDLCHELMSQWSRPLSKRQVADLAQAAHVPSFPLQTPAQMVSSEQLRHRHFWRRLELRGTAVTMPGQPFGLDLPPAASANKIARGPSSGTTLPLSGLRVLDFSWVIAGPTTTRYLAAMGAEVIKVEAPGTGDPGRASGLHEVLGQAKRGVVLDLKQPDGVAVAQALAERCDVLIENFATGVMDRFGLGVEALRRRNPGLIYISASGLGRTGPESTAVAYGTLLQCYTGFAGLNRHPGQPPRVGMAWLDPMCGLMLALAVAASVWRRRHDGVAARIDFSMVEAMLWTMAEPLLNAQFGQAVEAKGANDDRLAPHGVYHCTGNDAWVSIAIRNDNEWRRLVDLIPKLRPFAALACEQRHTRAPEIDRIISEWCKDQAASSIESTLVRAGLPAAAVVGQFDLVNDVHLKARGFWDRHGSGVQPALPWIASFGRNKGPAPQLGADTDAVLIGVLGLPTDDIAALRAAGALGQR